MPTIYTSLKMARWIGPVLPLPENPPVEDTWNANLFRVDRKQWLFFIHNPTAFVLVFPEVKKADLQHFDTIFAERFRNQLASEGIGQDLIDRVAVEPVAFYRTNNHSRNIGLMNNHLMNFKYFRGFPDTEIPSVNRINRWFTNVPTGPSHFTWPVEEMRKFLSR
jgi:hypothetical protein